MVYKDKDGVKEVSTPDIQLLWELRELCGRCKNFILSLWHRNSNTFLEL